MPRPRRQHPILRWMGVAACLTIGNAWLVSMYWIASATAAGHTIGIFAGNAIYMDHASPTSVEFEVTRLDGRWRGKTFSWTPHRSFLAASTLRSSYNLPLWIPLVLIAAPTASLWSRSRRRLPPGHCQNCGYNLTGNTSGLCPECGKTRTL